MVRPKIIFLSIIIFILSLTCLYQYRNLNILKSHYKTELHYNQCILQLKKLISTNIFLKNSDKMFQSSSHLKDDIKQICYSERIREVKFKQENNNNFSLKFKIRREEKIYRIIHRLKAELCGVLSIVKLSVYKLKNNQMIATICMHIFYPPNELNRFVKIKKLSSEKSFNIFRNEEPKLYQLNGINHYNNAYINGQSFDVGMLVGGYQIFKIYKNHIILKREGKERCIFLDERW